MIKVSRIDDLSRLTGLRDTDLLANCKIQAKSGQDKNLDEQFFDLNFKTQVLPSYFKHQTTVA